MSGLPFATVSPEPLVLLRRLTKPEASSAREDDRLRSLMNAYFDFVWRSLRRLGLSDADADDGTQEVFLVASRKLTAIEPLREKRYLFATAVKVASAARRSTRRRREEPEESLEQGDGALALSHDCEAYGPERLLELSRARQQLQDILDAMELEQRAVFILYELEQLTVPEIAATLSLPIGTVSSRLRAARDRFSDFVRRLHAKRALGGIA